MPDDVIHLEFGALRDEGETRYSLSSLSEAEIADLAAWIVPRVVKAMAAGALNWADEDERKAARPEPKRKKKTAEVI